MINSKFQIPNSKFIVANWKANKNILESTAWSRQITHYPLPVTRYQIIISPPFTCLFALKKQLKNKAISLSAQDISCFDDGPYTGEITGRMLQGLVDYVFIGHSERRKYFGETDEIVAKKISQAIKYKIKPIICCSNINQIPQELNQCKKDSYLIMFEPPNAISKKGVYRPDNPKHVQKTIAHWKSQKNLKCPMLYGGSVNPDNAASFLSQPDIDGIAVGHASLDVCEFIKILKNVT